MSSIKRLLAAIITSCLLLQSTGMSVFLDSVLASSTISIPSTTPGTLIPGVGYVIDVSGGTLSILGLNTYTSGEGNPVSTAVQNCTNSTTSGLSWNIVDSNQIAALEGGNINGMGTNYWLFEVVSGGIRQGYYQATAWGVGTVSNIGAGETAPWNIRCTTSTTDYAVNTAPTFSVSGAGGTVYSGNASSYPISITSITDPNASQTLTITYQVNSTAGTWNSVTTVATPASNLTRNFNADLSSFADGSVTVYVRVTDGIATTTNSTTLTKDSTAPTITITNPNGSAATSKTITASASEGTLTMNTNAGGICNGTLSFSAYASTTFTSETDNGKTVCYRAVDATGNAAYSISSAISGIDTTAPTITITNPNGSAATSKTITASANEGTLTMSIGTSMTCDSSRTFTAYSSATFSAEADNGKYVCYRAVDTAGNIRYSLSNQISGIDTTAPTITITNPNGVIATSKSVSASVDEGTLSYAVNASGVSTCNGTLTFGTYTSAINFSTISDNGKSVCFKAVDTAGNTSYALSVVIGSIDNIPTLSGLFTPSSYVNATNSGSVPFTLTGIADLDNGQTLTYSYSFDNSSFTPLAPAQTSPKSGSTYIFSLNLSSRPEGSFTLYVRVNDSMADSNIVSTTLTKDTVVPTVSITSFPIINISNQELVTLTGSCSENGRTVSVSVNTISDTSTCNSGHWSATLDLSALPDASAITATADTTDAAGNSAVQASKDATKDTTAPTITITNPNGVIATSKSVSASVDEGTLSYAVNASGVSTCNGTLTFGTYTSAINFSTISDNGKSVCFKAVDTAGNTSYALSVTLSNIGTPPSIFALKVDGVINPVGTTSLYPVFSYSFSDDDTGDIQSAYRIVVTDSGSNIVWDSGKISSSGSSIGFVGNTLSLDGNLYDVSVSVWDMQDMQSNTLRGTFTMLGKPIAPNVLTTTGIDTNSVGYTWNDNSSGQHQESSLAIEDGSGNVMVHSIAADTTVSSESSLLPNTRYTRKVCATNTAGTTCSAPIYFTTLANSPISFSAFPAYDGLNGQNIQLSWNRNGNSITNVYSGTTLIYSGALSIFMVDHLIPDTTYSFVAESLNADGVPSSTTISVSATTLPAAPDVTPSIPVSVPTNSATISFTNNLTTGIAGYRYTWDKLSTGIVTAGSTLWSSINTPLDLVPSSDGNWYLHLVAVNSSGSLGTTQADVGPFVYDRTPPEAMFISRFAQVSQTGFSLKGTCNYDPGSVVEISIDGSVIATLPMLNPCLVDYSYSSIPPGSHTVSVLTRDAAGNASSSTSIVVYNYDAGAILTPSAGSTVSTVFSITGFGRPNSSVAIYSGTGMVIASGSTDSLGHFAVQTTQAQPVGATTLDVAVGGVRRNVPIAINIASVGLKVPSITNVSDFDELTTKIPTIKISGEPLSLVRVYSKDSLSNYTEIGSVQLNASGNGEIISVVELPVGENVLYVVDDIFKISSQIKRVVLVDPWGYVYNTTTGDKIQGAKITLYDASGAVVALPTMNGLPQSNPVYSDATGYYGTWELPGAYRITVEKDGYIWPSIAKSSGTKNLDGSTNLGSHGQIFTVSGSILRIDIPMDPISTPAPSYFSAGAPLPQQKDRCSDSDLSPSYYDGTCIATTETGSEIVTDHLLGKLCYKVDPSFIDNTGTPGLEQAISKMISCGVVENGLVVEKTDKVYRYDVFRMIALTKSLNPEKYSISQSESSFVDLPKNYQDAKLAYMLRSKGYIPHPQTISRIYSQADSKFLVYELKKTFGYDATSDLRGKRFVSMKDYLLVLYKASEYAKKFDK